MHKHSRFHLIQNYPAILVYATIFCIIPFPKRKFCSGKNGNPSGKDYNKKDNRKQSLNPSSYTNLLISLLPAPGLDVKRTIWRGLKV